jgi:3-dehydroquinate dehydratase/shikimate dehydrogenase
MTQSTYLICSLMPTSLPELASLAARSEGADVLEFRIDALASLPSTADMATAVASLPLPVIVTCRPVREGGLYDGDESVRLSLLQEASTWDNALAVDVESDVADADLPTGAAMRIRSHHDFDTCPADLPQQRDRLDTLTGEVSKLAVACDSPSGAMNVLDLLPAPKQPTFALAMGEAGVITRLLARKLGAWGTFAALSESECSAPGQPTLHDFLHLYRWNDQSPETQVFGVVGCPVGHSMSPAIHNAALAKANINGVYLPLLTPPSQEAFDGLIDGILQRPHLSVRGLSVTIPHKENALRYLGPERCDAQALRIGAVNTLTFDDDGTARGTNTDLDGALDALTSAMNCSREQLAGLPVALLGAGGASRAIVAGLTQYGAEVTIYNRTVGKAESLATEFDCRHASLDDLPSTTAEVLINGTSLGMIPHPDSCCVESMPSSVRVVFDTVYNPLETRLLTLANDSGCLCVTGLEMLVAQAAEQFRLWTGVSPDPGVMLQIARKRLGA